MNLALKVIKLNNKQNSMYLERNSDDKKEILQQNQELLLVYKDQ